MKLIGIKFNFKKKPISATQNNSKQKITFCADFFQKHPGSHFPSKRADRQKFILEGEFWKIYNFSLENLLFLGNPEKISKNCILLQHINFLLSQLFLVISWHCDIFWNLIFKISGGVIKKWSRIKIGKKSESSKLTMSNFAKSKFSEIKASKFRNFVPSLIRMPSTIF